MFDLVLKDLIFHQQLTPVSLWHEDRLKGRGGVVAVGGGGLMISQRVARNTNSGDLLSSPRTTPLARTSPAD